jgi:hypothetical protein
MKLHLIAFLSLVMVIDLYGDIVVVGGKNFPTENLTEASLKRLFLGHLSFYEGERVQLHQIEGDLLKDFCKKFLQVSMSNYERRWARRIFTGKGRVPRTYKTSSDMLKSLAESEHGLAFVDSNVELPAGVRVIPIIKGD